MDRNQFWKIIDSACRSDPASAEDWDARLTAKLAELPPDEIISWDQLFDRFAAEAYRTDLWAAAYIINGGASDDGFYYFRCWLIGMGEDIYNKTIANPDSLADLATPDWYAEGIDAEAEIYAAAHRAWMQVTGQPDTAEYPVRGEAAELVGDEWDFDDPAAMRKRLPRLWALYDEKA